MCVPTQTQSKFVPVPERDRANVSGNADRPGTGIEAQTFEAQTGMSGALAEELIRSPSRSSNFGRELVIKLPKLRCRTGAHAPLIEIALGDFWIRVWVREKISVVAIQQRGEARARLVIAQNTLPLGING